ncbi:MAG: RHS repeat-associated core domain-containing protein [Gemmatimonadetes bacterium]|nr:RHS repeat-associated core domain-containing protein [Gemmatimonadota bacterium]
MDRLLALRATTPVVDTLAAILDPINGTVRGLARFRTGAKVKEFAEAPWGDAVADTGLVVRYHFAGREYDSESGLYYMRARYYDPALGRWISEAPIGIAGGLNVYAYAGNDPVNLTDPSGLDPDCKPIDVPPGPGQIPGIGQECKRPWNPFGPGGPLEWLDPSNDCGMDVFHDPECSGYPDQDVLDYYSGLGGGGNKGSHSPGSGPRDKLRVLKECLTGQTLSEVATAGVVFGGGTTSGLVGSGLIADAYAKSLIRDAFGASDASAFTWDNGIALVRNPEVQRLATAGRGLMRLGGYAALATVAIEIFELRSPWVCYWTNTGP